MVSFIVLCCVLIISRHCAHGQDQLFQAMYNAVPQAFDDINKEIAKPLESYDLGLKKMLYALHSLVIVQNTNTSLYMLDICGFGQTLIEFLVGVRLSDLPDQFHNTLMQVQEVSEIDTFKIKCEDIVTFGYNMFLVDSENGTIIDTVITDKWGGTTLASLFTEGTPRFKHVK